MIQLLTRVLTRRDNGKWLCGMDYSRIFNDRAMKTHLELSLRGEAEEVGLQSLNNAPTEILKTTEERKKKERQTGLFRLLAQTQWNLQNFIERMDRDLITAKDELQRYLDMIDERKALTHCLDVLGKGGVLERNPDGSLKDRHLHNALEHYAKDKNLSTDFSDDAYVLNLAGSAIQTYPTNSQLEELVEVQTKIVDVMQTGHDEAVLIQQDLDNADNLTDDEIREKCQKADDIMNTEQQDRERLIAKKNAILSNEQSQEVEAPKPQSAVISPSF